MMIRILPGDFRRMAWTDRKNGYFELLSCSADSCGGGYFRGETRYLADVFLCPEDHADLYRINAAETLVQPEGLTVIFNRPSSAHPSGSLGLHVSLLINEQAFWLSLSASRVFDSSRGSAAVPHAGFGLVFDSSLSGGRWTRAEHGSAVVWHNHAGAAIASVSPFTVESPDRDRAVLYAEGSSNPGWYLAFESTPERACAKAASLAASDAVCAHRKSVAEFVDSCALDTGDPAFDSAVKWARFSGWMLAVNDHGPGIWAGLPWFRDNWGRDTFIALSGILLTSGRFKEAREVLVSFARHQNKDPESPDWGRIPNRFRGSNDVIYNTADGTLWFIRSLWEYLQYTGDLEILEELGPTVDLALESDATRRTDSNGLLLHGDADTWMDARIRGNEPWSPRGDRANDIQSLWYTALVIGSRIARLKGFPALAEERAAQARRVKDSFRRLFWCPSRKALADHLPPGPHGEWLRDFRVRPNQLFALTAPAILDSPQTSGKEGFETALLDAAQSDSVLENVTRELASPFGLFSLSPEDPLFHPRHEYPGRYHKDAAYHNGTIWVWNTGPYVTAAALSQTRAGTGSGTLPDLAAALLREEARMILEDGCAGSLSENIHAEPGADGKPVLSGTWSQAWSVSEFARNAFQDLVGFNPRLIDRQIELRPCLPRGMNRVAAEVFFGPGWKLSIELRRPDADGGMWCSLLWNPGVSPDKTGSRLSLRPLMVCGRLLEADKSLEFLLPAAEPGVSFPPSFPARRFDAEFCGAIHRDDWLEQLILSGRMKSPHGGGSNAAALEWFFDSDYFIEKYRTKAELGAVYSRDETVFRLWAPTARNVQLVLYRGDSSAEPDAVLPAREGTVQEGRAGIWERSLPGDQHGLYYAWRVTAHGITRESPDPYARACGCNGLRSQVVDPEATDPPGWNKTAAPSLGSPSDAVVCEVHVADLTSSPTWDGPESSRRTYEGAALAGTSFKGFSTGFDHLKTMGFTHVQLMPVFDFSSVDESRSRDPEYRSRFVSGAYNWGYDPGNYSVPEGSYSSDPSDGAARIRELKTLVRDYAAAGMGVIMDVVYNHVPAAQNHPLGICVPGYYFRVDSYSGAGDDTASERVMFREYMKQSLCWWLSRYKLSGFRFDLMGLHDVETMNEIMRELRRIKGDVLVYGEGWDMYRAGKMVGASMKEARKMPGIGFFNDAFRCGIKGPVFNAMEGGFVHDGSHREAVKFGLVGAVFHPQVHNRKVDGTANPNPWSDHPGTSVNYAEIHDNATLYDKLVLVEERADESRYEALAKLSIALVVLSQGMPILHAGMEFLRTKEIPPSILAEHPDLYDLWRTSDKKRAFSHNTYNLGDAVNALDWSRRAEKDSVVEYTRGLIALRNPRPLFRLGTAEAVARSLSFLESASQPAPHPAAGNGAVSADSAAGTSAESASCLAAPPILGWTIDGDAVQDAWKGVCVLVNPAEIPQIVALPSSFKGGPWRLVCDETGVLKGDSGARAGAEGGRLVTVPKKALYLYAEF